MSISKRTPRRRHVAVPVMDIAFDAALSAAQGALDEAKASELKVCVALVDRSGNPLVAMRLPGAPLHCIELALDKAYTSASFGFPTSDWGAILASSATLACGLPPRPRWAVVGGGFPVVLDGQVVGAIGVSGGTEAQDIQCALSGLRSLGLQPTS